MATIDPVLRAAVWQRYERDQPGPGSQYIDWVSGIAQESATPVATIRRIISEGSASFLHAVSNQTQTTAMKLADLLGADLVQALDTVRSALGASKKKLIVDSKGRPKLDDNGNEMYAETEDWPVRLSAAKTLIDVYGAKAPDKLEITAKSVHLDLTTEDALQQLKDTAQRLAQLEQDLTHGADGAGGAARQRAALNGGYRSQ